MLQIGSLPWIILTISRFGHPAALAARAITLKLSAFLGLERRVLSVLSVHDFGLWAGCLSLDTRSHPLDRDVTGILPTFCTHNHDTAWPSCQ